MVKIVKGDIFQGKEAILCHQVNCRGVMGSGLAKQIKERYPSAYEDYMEYVNANYTVNILGQVIFSDVEDRTIAHLFGQDGYGYGSRNTNYGALASSLMRLGNSLDSFWPFTSEPTIAIPHGMGCGLGGGDWGVVCELIEFLLEGYDVTIYKLEVD